VALEQKDWSEHLFCGASGYVGIFPRILSSLWTIGYVHILKPPGEAAILNKQFFLDVN
jgi:hypothetical protein